MNGINVCSILIDQLKINNFLKLNLSLTKNFYSKVVINFTDVFNHFTKLKEILKLYKSKNFSNLNFLIIFLYNCH